MSGGGNPAGAPLSSTNPLSLGNGSSGPEGGTATPEGLSSPFPMGFKPPGIISPQESKSQMDWARLALAAFSVALLGFIVVAAFITLWRRQDVDALTRLLEIIFAPVVAVVAAAVAFYYRSSTLLQQT